VDAGGGRRGREVRRRRGGEDRAVALGGPQVGEAGGHVHGARVGDAAGEADGRAHGPGRRGAHEGDNRVKVRHLEGRGARHAEGAELVLHDQADHERAVVVRGEGEGGLRAGGEGGRAAVLGDGPGVEERVAGDGVADVAGERDRRALGGVRREVRDDTRGGGVAAGDGNVRAELRHGPDADRGDGRARADARGQRDQEAEQVRRVLAGRPGAVAAGAGVAVLGRAFRQGDEVRFALAEAGGVGGGEVELHRHAGPGEAVQLQVVAENGRATEDGEVLEAVGVAGVVGGDAGGAHVDAEPGVGVDGIPAHRAAGGGHGGEGDAGPGVEGDDVGGAGGRAADRLRVRV